MIGATGMRLALIGTAAGAVGAFALTRFLDKLLFGVSSVDAATFFSMAGDTDRGYDVRVLRARAPRQQK